MLLLLLSIAANFGFGRWVAAVQARGARLRRTAVSVAVAANLPLLAVQGLPLGVQLIGYFRED